MPIRQVEADSEAAPPKGLGVLLVASFALVRIALKQLLSTTCEVSIVGDAPPGPEALDLARRSPPDIAVIDTQRLDGDLTAFVRRLLAVSPDLRAIILSDDGFEDGVIQALQIGAWGYLPRDVSQSELIRAVHQVAGGKLVIGCSLQPGQMARLRELGQPRPSMHGALSHRQTMVIRAMAAGHTDSQIAKQLGVSVPTIKTHVRSVLRKTNSRNRAAAIATAFRSGVLS